MRAQIHTGPPKPRIPTPASLAAERSARTQAEIDRQLEARRAEALENQDASRWRLARLNPHCR